MEELKEFNFRVAKEQVQKVATYLAEKMNFTIVKPLNEPITDGDYQSSRAEIINYFIIEKSNQHPIYKQINSKKDIDMVSEKVLSLTEYLSDDLNEILDHNESQMDNNLIETIELMNRIVEKFIKAFRTASKRLEFESVTIDELQIDYGRYLGKELKNRFINLLIPGIYTGMINGNSDIYSLILSKVNSYLAKLGISTFIIEIGDKMNYDNLCVLASDDNITIDYKQDETIKEICQLPYMFDETLVAEGQAVVWRLKR